MPENWLYQPTLDQMSRQHDANLTCLLPRFRSPISLPDCVSYGTKKIQIDVLAADCHRRLLAIAECKDWLSFQGASGCAEEITLKTYLLTTFLTGDLGMCPTDGLAGYDLVQYVSLGSYQGLGYPHCKASTVAELNGRMEKFSTYLEMIDRKQLGIFLFLDGQTQPIIRQAALRKWPVGVASTPRREQAK